MKKGFSLCALCLATQLAAGCASNSLRPPIARPNLVEATSREAAWTEITCDNKEAKVAGVEAFLIGVALDFTINFIKSSLDQLQKGRNAMFTASGVFDNCAKDLTSKEKPRSATLTLTRAIIGKDGKISDGKQAGFKLDGVLNFAVINKTDAKTPDQVNVTFTPTGLIYGSTSAPVRGKGRKHVVVLIALTENAKLKASAAPSEEQLGTVLRIDLGTLQDGKIYSSEILKPTAQASAVIPLSLAPHLNATALVIETENESLALKALTDAFSSNTDNLKKAIREILGVKD